MSARRRRVGSESEAAPILIQTDQNTHDSYDKHAGKLKAYNGSWRTHESNLSVKGEEVSDRMAARDRTEEFVKLIQTNKARQMTSAVSVRDPRRSVHIQGHAEFMAVARTIGENVASTYAKLETLTQLAKNKSNYIDKTGEIEKLTYIIKIDLNSLNDQIAKLQQVAKLQKQSHHNGKKHLVSHSSNVVLALQSKLANMSTDFKKALEVRTEALAKQKSKREEYSQSVVPSNMLSGSSVLDEYSLDMEQGMTPQTPLLQSQQHLLYDQSRYLESRAETMQNIESTIVELGGIFKHLAEMVQEQEEMVDRIDSNVESASVNIESAHSQLIRYFQSVTSNRWLMLKIFGVLIFFFVFFVVFMT